MGNDHTIRQLAPFPVPFGAVIPVNQGHWEEMVRQSAPWFPPNWDGKPSDFHLLDRYGINLVRSMGTIDAPLLEREGTAIRRSGDYLCVETGANLRCPLFPPHPPARNRWERFRLSSMREADPKSGYLSFVGILGWLAPHLEDALIFIAADEGPFFLDRINITSGILQRTRLESGYWFNLDAATESDLVGMRAEDGSPIASSGQA